MPPGIGIVTRRVGACEQRRRQARALVADRDAPTARAAARRRASIAPRGDGRDHCAAARARTRRPRRQIDVLDDRRQRSARPARRAAPWATTRTRSASTAAPARRRPRRRCAGSCRRCPGSCTSSSSRWNRARRGQRRRAASRRRPARRRRPAATTVSANSAARHDQHVARRHARDQRRDARVVRALLDDEQRFAARRRGRDRRRPDARPRARTCRACGGRATTR